MFRTPRRRSSVFMLSTVRSATYVCESRTYIINSLHFVLSGPGGAHMRDVLGEVDPFECVARGAVG